MSDTREVAEAAQSAVESFRESVAAGDLSIALSWLDGEATLVDPLVREATRSASLGELLLELRSRHAEGVTYEPLETDVVVSGEAAAMVVTLLSVVGGGDDAGSEDVKTVLETVFLIGSEEGWKIRHLHRSLSPEP